MGLKPINAIKNFKLKLGTKKFNKNITELKEKTENKFEKSYTDSIVDKQDIHSKKRWVREQRRKAKSTIRELKRYFENLKQKEKEIQKKIDECNKKLGKMVTKSKLNSDQIGQTIEYKKLIEYKRRADEITNLKTNIKRKAKTLLKMIAKDYSKTK